MSLVPNVYATHSAWLNLNTLCPPNWKSTLNPNSLNRPQVTNTSGVICRIKVTSQGSQSLQQHLSALHCTSQNSWLEKLLPLYNYPAIPHMPFSICGPTVTQLNTVFCWEDVSLKPPFSNTPALINWFINSSHLLNTVWKCCYDLDCVDDCEGCSFLMLLFWYFPENKNNFVGKWVITAVALLLPQEASSTLKIHWTYRIFTLYRLAVFWMDRVEWKHISKGLCRIPAFLDNLETGMFSFPGPRTAYRDRHWAQRHPEGRGWPGRAGIGEAEGWRADSCRPGGAASYQRAARPHTYVEHLK